MMQSELLLPSWPAFNYVTSNLDHNMPYNQETMIFSADNGFDFPSSYPSPNDSSNSYAPITLTDEFVDFENFGEEILAGSGMELDIDSIPAGEIDDFCQWINENCSEGNSSSPVTMEGDGWSPSFSLDSSQNSVQFPAMDMAVVLPGDDMMLDSYSSLLHLLRAYGEAVENGEKELAEVIAQSVKEKSSPVGNTSERVAYNLFQSREDQGEYLRQESIKNFYAAFKVFYPSLPNGRFAHLVANSAILENVPDDMEMIHWIDFDMGEAMQLPQVIEALARKHKALRLTSIKSGKESASSFWDFERTKEQLQNYASQSGLKIVIEEKEIAVVVDDLMRMKRSEQKNEWLVFNCMVGLPHMGRRRPRSHVTEFVKVAKEFLAELPGMLILGDGEAVESLSTNSGSTPHFEKFFRHCQAIFESLEMNFPGYLVEARTALESLFLAPFMCPLDWSTQMTDIRGQTGLEGRKFSQENLAEARHLVNEREDSYKVQIEGDSEHEMVLQWKETPLVRVSIWM